jgi:DHA2 family multidrug resistance protein
MTTINKRFSEIPKKPAIVDQKDYIEGPLKWAIALTASLGAILEVIDTSIVNVALTDIHASLGATLSEVGWVVSGYGIANVVLIPLSAWLGDYFGRKSYFIFSLIGFTISSVLCGISYNLTMLIAARILQGLCGGGLLAKAQAILFETFPPSEQGLAQAVFGVGVIAGPAIGPTLGGFLVDGLGWRWIFLVNIPFGIVAVAMAMAFLPKNKEKNDTKNQAVDWLGIGLLIVAVGSIQTVLEQGETEGWFSSRFIVTLAIAGIIGLGLFIWRELKTDHPAVNLRVLRHRSLAAGSLLSAVVGMGLYGTLFAVPIFAQSVLGFTATQTGLLLAPGALASATGMILLGKLSNIVDPRFLIIIGAVGSSGVMFQLATITPQSGTDDLFWPLVCRGGFTVFMFLPLSLAVLGPLPKQDISAGSGFYNLTRQLGGSIGIALLTTLLDRRETFHRNILLAKLSAYDPETHQRLDLLNQLLQSQGMNVARAKQQALTLLSQTVDTQAAVLSYADCFRVVGIGFLCSLPLLLFLGKGRAGAKAPVGH